MKKIVWVMNIPSPYRLHTFRVVEAACRGRGIDFHIHFMARGHADRPASWLNPKIDFPYTYWRDFGCGQHHFNPCLIWKMILRSSDWMICGSSFDTFTGIAVLVLVSRMGHISLEENAEFWRSEKAVKRYLDGLGVNG